MYQLLPRQIEHAVDQIYAEGGVARPLLQPQPFCPLARQGDGRRRGGRRLKGLVRPCPAEGPGEGGQHTAAAGDAGHGGAAVAEKEDPVPLGDDIHRPGEGHRRPGPLGQGAGQSRRLGQARLGDGIGGSHIHPAAPLLVLGEGPDLRGVAPDNGKLHFFQQPAGGLPPQAGKPGGHRVKDHRHSQLVGLFSGNEHGLPVPHRPQVEHQGLNARHRVGHLQRMVGHGGGGSRRQQNVGAVVDGDDVGNTLDQGGFLPHCLQQGGKFASLHGPHRLTRVCMTPRPPERFRAKSTTPAMIEPPTVDTRKGPM